MNGNYYAIDIWGLIAALVMVAIAAGISETMRMGVGRTLLWSACRALLQLCAMGFIMEYVIRSNNPWLVLLLVAGGATDAMSKVYEELGVSALKNHFLLYTFMMAFALCVVVCLVKKQGVTKEDVGFGLVIGIPNFCSALFLLLSLADIPAMIAYPTYSVAAIVMVTLVGVIFFKEKLSRRQILSMFMIFAALVLLNI